MKKLKDGKIPNPNARKIHVAYRVTIREKALIRSNAVAFTNGDESKWARYAALHFKPGKGDFK